MVLDVDDVGASLAFATVTIARTSRTVPPQQTAPDDPWATVGLFLHVEDSVMAAGDDVAPSQQAWAQQGQGQFGQQQPPGSAGHPAALTSSTTSP
ncbi:hypothetical protein [Streptomyces sp. NPDC056069]|uniref:hypothetical protein n=1 Tax=Streptomyces sp. NPDC056069 TaxID=3345702 RepID=UPI0035DD5F09